MARYRPLHLHDDAVHRDARVEVPEGRPLRVAVISDTHSKPHPASVEAVAAREPDVILHGGDIGDLSVLDAFADLAPLHAVRGNIDAVGDGAPPESIKLTLARGEDTRLVVMLVHIAVQGPRLRADTARFAKAHGAQLVICGHSHVPFIGRDRDLLVFNPGSIGPRRFSLPITFGMIEISESLDLFHVSCETGERWLPPG